MLEQIIIFGAFNTGKKAYQTLKLQYQVVAFADNCMNYHGKKMWGIPIIPPEMIPSLSADIVIIASLNYYKEIAGQLFSMGVKNIKLFWPRFEDRKYLLLEVNEMPFSNSIYRQLEMKRDKNDRENVKKYSFKKNVLIIAYYFPPEGGSPIQRTLKFVKYMRDYGYEPIVLTVETDSSFNKGPMDESLILEIPEGVKVVRIKDEFLWANILSKEKIQEITEFLYSLSDSKEWMDQFIEAQKTQDLYILPDRLVLWANECVRHIEEYINMQEIDLLYSTVPEWSPHLIAYFLKKKYEIKWVADYRDPWVSNRDYVKLYYPWMTEEEIALDQELEKKLVKEMDSIIVAGGKWKADFIKNYGVASYKIKEITNGYDEADFINIHTKTKKNEKFTLCYNGRISYHRNPIPLMRAINLLIEENEIDRNEIQWIFNGIITEPFFKSMEEEDKYHIILKNGMLSHKESIQIAINSDLMVMYGEHGEKGFLNYPGKFYEYLRIGRPILCFSSKGSFQSDVLQETRMGVNLDLYDLDGMKQFLKNQIAVWRTSKELNPGMISSVQKYERRNLTRILTEEFNHLIGESR